LVIPAVEALILDLGILGFNRYVSNASFAYISLSSIEANFKSGPRLDNDDIYVNFLGHPYQGSAPFNLARSMGLSFWEAVPYTVISDLAWEFMFEVQAPSTNDLIESGVGGVIWGEAFYRISALLLDDPSLPLPVRYFTAVAINPAAVFNDLVLGPPPREPGLSSIPWNGRMYLGTLWLSDGSVREQVLVSVDLSYGVPEEPGDGCQKPFETFDLKADFGFLGSPTGDGFIRGLIAGCRMGSHAVPGVWGLFGLTDFDTAPSFRLSATSLGPGATISMNPVGRLHLELTAVAAGVAMAASGTTAETAYVDPNGGVPPKPSLYSVGPGGEALFDGTASWGNAVSLRATARSWWISAVTPVRGLERVTVAALGLFVRLPGTQFLSAEASYQRRDPAQPYDMLQSDWTGRLVWGFDLGLGHGP
jgi:hypothetical protein